MVVIDKIVIHKMLRIKFMRCKRCYIYLHLQTHNFSLYTLIYLHTIKIDKLCPRGTRISC